MARNFQNENQESCKMVWKKPELSSAQKLVYQVVTNLRREKLEKEETSELRKIQTNKKVRYSPKIVLTKDPQNKEY